MVWLSALLVAAGLAAVGPGPAGLTGSALGQAAPPAITLNPASDGAGNSGTWMVAVTGSGFRADFDTGVVFGSEPPVQVVVRTNTKGQFSTVLAPPRGPGGGYLVRATQPCVTTAVACFPIQATATFTAVPTLRALDQASFGTTRQERCGPPGPGREWLINVSGAFWRGDRERTIVLTFNSVANRAPIASMSTSAGAANTFSVPLWRVPAQPAAADGTYAIVANDGDARAVLAWQVPCPPLATTTTPPTTEAPTTSVGPTTSQPPAGRTTTSLGPTTTAPPDRPPAAQPVLSCTPCVGAGGLVVQVNGQGFAASSPVVLRWSPGLGEATAFTDAAGGFGAPVLILARDVPGPRQLITTDGAGNVASVDVVVVPSTVEPSGRLGPGFSLRTTQLLQR
ncbi:MAG: hypothetical protein ACRD0M_06855 [Acidimicrobiales bacterium]